VRKPTTFQLKESEKKPSVYDRLSRLSGIKRSGEERFVKGFKSKEETTLKELVDRNYKKNLKEQTAEKKPRPDLVDNFHWVIMRARRFKKLTQEQLAKEISESEAAINLAERGILPEDDYRLLNKLESFLRVKLVKDGFEKPELTLKQPARIIKFDPVAMQNLKIADLQEIKKAKESGNMEVFEDESDLNEEDFDEDEDREEEKW